MLEAIKLWRLFPTQIASDLRRYYPGCHIRDWHQGRMSSRELLELLAELPETSRFKEAAERTFRVVEYRGPDPNLKDQLLLIPGYGKLPKDVAVVGEYVDWTLDRKIAARNVRELVMLRNDGRDTTPDLAGLYEPLHEVLAQRERQKRADLVAKARAHVHRGAYSYERR
ncbi:MULTISPECIES: hypothetical protein [Mycobacterium]|uniref:Uncharacterized protein n=2 Tax=Mycobacterium TaxID=1763 RepID=A0A7I9XXC2_9MYCO|nr:MULTISPECIES: hypothetical protein [Mycobacterium]MDO2351676.1 hypothetical protein [Mycobacterium avium subsp. hominissuis]GFG74436.1 hypothetical protein MBOT_18010 [Mycobacterium botniense]